MWLEPMVSWFYSLMVPSFQQQLLWGSFKMKQEIDQKWVKQDKPRGIKRQFPACFQEFPFTIPIKQWNFNFFTRPPLSANYYSLEGIPFSIWFREDVTWKYSWGAKSKWPTGEKLPYCESKILFYYVNFFHCFFRQRCQGKLLLK